MRRLLFGIALVAVVALSSAASYWLGRTHEDASSQASALVTQAQAADSTLPAQAASPQERTPVAADGSKNGKILYYMDPMGKPDYSPVPKKDSMGMDYVPVYEGADDNAQPISTATAPAPNSKPK